MGYDRKLWIELILIILTICIVEGCKKSDHDQIDFCKMLELDQSFVNIDQSNIEKYNSDRLKRHAIFRDNFRNLIKYSTVNGFPELTSLKLPGVDSCRNWAVKMTLFHVGQTQPELFFENDTKKLFKKEIEEGRLKIKPIFSALWEGFNDHRFCLEYKDEIHAALNSWQIDVDELPKIRFVECEE